MYAKNADLKAVRYFIVLADTLSFRQAAARLGVSQPALSFALQRLEEKLGVQLLRRSSRAVELTPAGRTYLDGARALLSEVARLEQSVADVAGGKRGSCRFGFVQSSAFDFVPRVALRLRQEAPGIKLLPTEHTSLDQLRLLIAGELDIGLVRQSYYAQGELELKCVHRQRFVAALPASHRLAASNSIPLAALANDEFIVGPERRTPALNASMRNACARAGFEPRIALQVVEFATILAFVGAELGVALIPASLKRFSDQTVSLVDIDDDTEHLELALYLATRKPERDPAVSRVAAIVRSIADQDLER